jgi:hypothetical protein
MEAHLARMPAVTSEQLLKPEVVAERLSVELDFVLNQIKEGRLEAVELASGVVRVSERALGRYVQALKRVERR